MLGLGEIVIYHISNLNMGLCLFKFRCQDEFRRRGLHRESVIQFATGFELAESTSLALPLGLEDV